MNWKDAVKVSLDRYTTRHRTSQINRSTFLAEELDSLIQLTQSAGKTPGQTVSRVLQELRDEGYLFFSQSGQYVVNSKPFDLASEDAEFDVIDNAIETEQLVLNDVAVTNTLAVARVRSGVAALRRATLQNFGCECALCDIGDQILLVASHIARWSDRPNARGKLSNIICLCKFHDSLFEHGYFALTNNFKLIRRSEVKSHAISSWFEHCTVDFKVPKRPPAAEYLEEHRKRVGLG